MEISKKGTAIKAFFKRPQKHGHILLCYIGLYTVLQLQLVCARHHDLGKLLGSINNSNNNNNDDDNNNNNNFNENNHLNSIQQQPQQQQQTNYNAQDIHSLQLEQQQQQILKQQPILDSKITQQSPSEGPSGVVLSKDDGKYQVPFHVNASLSLCCFFLF